MTDNNGHEGMKRLIDLSINVIRHIFPFSWLQMCSLPPKVAMYINSLLVTPKYDNTEVGLSIFKENHRHVIPPKKFASSLETFGKKEIQYMWSILLIIR